MKYFELLEQLKNENIDLDDAKFVIEETKGKNLVYFINDDVYALTLDRISLLKKGLPPQYIVGHTYFYGLRLFCDERVLIPRFDTESVVDEALKLIKSKNYKKVLDGFCGSGAIAIAIAKEIDTKVDAFDISADAIDVARLNAKENNVDVGCFLSDVFSNVKDKYDIFIANPPYIKYGDSDLEKRVKEFEPSLALYASEDGLYFYRIIAENVRSILNDDYSVVLEIPYNKRGELAKIAIENNFDFEIKKDLAGNDRVMILKEKT